MFLHCISCQPLFRYGNAVLKFLSANSSVPLPFSCRLVLLYAHSKYFCHTVLLHVCSAGFLSITFLLHLPLHLFSCSPVLHVSSPYFCLPVLLEVHQRIPIYLYTCTMYIRIFSLYYSCLPVFLHVIVHSMIFLSACPSAYTSPVFLSSCPCVCSLASITFHLSFCIFCNFPVCSPVHSVILLSVSFCVYLYRYSCLPVLLGLSFPVILSTFQSACSFAVFLSTCPSACSFAVFMFTCPSACSFTVFL